MSKITKEEVLAALDQVMAEMRKMSPEEYMEHLLSLENTSISDAFSDMVEVGIYPAIGSNGED